MLHSQLSLEAIRYMSVPEMKLWEGLPLLFPGQDMGEVGPISTDVRDEPYPLPQGFEWCIVDFSNLDEITQDLDFMARNLLRLWYPICSQHIGYLLGIRLS